MIKQIPSIRAKLYVVGVVNKKMKSDEKIKN